MAKKTQPTFAPVETNAVAICKVESSKSKYITNVKLTKVLKYLTRGQSNLTKSAHSPVRGHPRGSKVVPLNSWGRVSY